MATNPITVPLPQDLPTNWQENQIVAPEGADVGLPEEYGYNYLAEQVNAAQKAAMEIGEAFEPLLSTAPGSPPLPVGNGGTGAITAAQAIANLGAVPTSRTVNGKALSGNITLAAADVGAVPTSRTINGKALSGNIALAAADVGAAPTSHASTSTGYGVGTTTSYGHVRATAGNGLAISNGTLSMAAANGSTPGAMTGGTQSINGNKTFTGQVVVGNPAVATQAARKIYAGTADMTHGVTALATGVIYIKYKA